MKEERKQARAKEAKEGPGATSRSTHPKWSAKGGRSAAATAVSVVLPSIEELLAASPTSRAARCTPRAADLRQASIFLRSPSAVLPAALCKLLGIRPAPRRQLLTNERQKQREEHLLALVQKDKVKAASCDQAASFKLKNTLLCDLTLDLASADTCAVSSIAAGSNASRGSGQGRLPRLLRAQLVALGTFRGRGRATQPQPQVLELAAFKLHWP